MVPDTRPAMLESQERQERNMKAANVLPIRAPGYSVHRHAACSDCSLSRICLPMDLDRAGLERMDCLVDRTPPMHEGEHLFRVGDGFKNIYAVRAGSFKSYTV